MESEVCRNMEEGSNFYSGDLTRGIPEGPRHAEGKEQIKKSKRRGAVAANQGGKKISEER